MLERLTKVQQKHPKIFAGALILIYAIFFVLALQLEIDPSFSSLVPEDSEFNTNDRILRASFEQNDALLILLKKDPTSVLQNRIENFSNSVIDDYVAQLQTTLSESQYVLSVSPSEISDNGEQARIILSLQTPDRPDSFELVQKEVNYLMSEVGEPVGIDAQLTGMPILMNRISTLLITDNLVTIFITLLAIFALLYAYSRDFIFTLCLLIPPILSLIVLAGMMTLLNIGVTITLAAVGVLVLGLGADYSIHIFVHYRKHRKENPDHFAALLETVKDLQKPITASFITTFAGFIALILGVSPSSQAQGMVLALAIAIIFVNTFILFPLLIIFFDGMMQIKENAIFRHIRNFLGKFAIYQSQHAKTVLFVLFLLTVVMLFGASKVEFSTANNNWIPDSDPIALSFREITYTYGDVETMSIIFTATQGDLRNAQFAKDVQDFILKLESIDSVDSITTVYDGVSLEHDELHETLTAATGAFNEDYTLTVLRMSSLNFGVAEDGSTKALTELRALLKSHDFYHATTTLYGNPVRFEELGNSLEQDAGVTTVIGLALVFLVATLIYASVRVGFLALLPIIIAVIWAVGLMGFFKVPFTSLSTGIISLVLGVGVDFSIHLVDGILKRLKIDSLTNAISDTLTTSGSAILLSSITTFVGFLALTFATLLGTQRLGWSLAFSIVSVFIVSMTFVPAVLSLGRKVKS